MKRKSDKIKNWRQNTKRKLVEGFGGKCNKCGYNKCFDSLDFHHIDPIQKDFSIGDALASPKKWDILVREAQKCIMLCKNCHIELHSGLWQLSEIQQFCFTGEETQEKKIIINNCKFCNKAFNKNQIYCSSVCVGLDKQKNSWNELELKELLESKSVSDIAKIFNVSRTTIDKKIRKFGLM